MNCINITNLIMYCPLCNSVLIAKLSKNIAYKKSSENRDSILKSGFSLISEKLNLISSKSCKNTCDGCFSQIKTLLDLVKLFKETEVKIQEIFKWISEQDGILELKDLEFEVKTEPQEDIDVDFDNIDVYDHHKVKVESGGHSSSSGCDIIDGSILPLVGVDHVSTNGSTLENNDTTVERPELDNSVGTILGGRKRKVLNGKEKEGKCERRRKSAKMSKKLQDYKQFLNIRIENMSKSRDKYSEEDSTYILNLDINPKLQKQSYANVSRSKDLPEVILQDIVHLLPSQIKKRLDPLVDCRFTVEQSAMNVVKIKDGSKDDMENIEYENQASEENFIFDDNPGSESENKSEWILKDEANTRRMHMQKRNRKSNSFLSSQKKLQRKSRTKGESGKTINVKRIKVPEIDFRTLSSLTVVNGRKYFLHHVCEEDDNYLFCGFPNCDFKLLENALESEAPCNDRLMNHITEIHFEDPSNIEYKSRHNLVPSCSTCGQTFRTLLSLYTHNWTHYNESEREALIAQGFTDQSHGLYRCPKCSKKFKVKYRLTNHLASHRPTFLCDICGMEKTTKYAMNVHKQRHHPGSLIGEWNNCPICPMKFIYKGFLQRHMDRSHGGEKKSLCDKCGMKFIFKRDLDHHLISHNPPEWRPFKCHVCPEAYRYRKNLQRHVVSAHGPEFATRLGSIPITTDPPLLVHSCKQKFPCIRCDKVFDLRSKLTKHFKKKHRDQENVLE